MWSRRSLVQRRLLFIIMYSFLNSARLARAFVFPARQRGMLACRLFAATSLPDITSMRAGEIKKELESYGINTKSFLEKSELVEALTKAREEGLQPKASTSASAAPTEDSSDTRPREERLQEEKQKCQSMKASEMKKELQERGVSTKALFEKSEFLQALAEARVDNVQKKTSGSGGNNNEGYAEYADVEVLTDDTSGPRKRNQPGSSPGGSSSPFGAGSPFGSGASPFGGGGGMPGMGGMGGMGGIADMLKNMGGASPFGGAANPFAGAGGGDVMGKAQEMMQNPRVRELMAKAQSNPRLMKILNECMTNPMAISKYENDPEVADLVKELKKFM